MAVLSRTYSRRAWPLVAALAIHGAAWIAVERTRVRAQGGAESSDAVVEELVVELEANDEHAATSAPLSAVPAANTVARATAQPHRRAPPRLGASEIAASDPEPAGAGIPLRASPSDSPRPQVDLGIDPGAWSRWGAFTEAAPPEQSPDADQARGARPPPSSSSAGLLEAMEAGDRALGLGPSGAVLSAVREAARSESAPHFGIAQFSVTVYEQGEVEVTVAARDGDAAAWRDAGERLAAILRKRPPRVGASRKGARWLVELAAQERRATGELVGPERVRGSVTAPTLRSSEDAKLDLARRNPAIAPPPGAPAEARAMAPINNAPGVFVGTRGRAGDVSVGLGTYAELGHGDPGQRVAGGLVLKGNIDPTNLVAGSSRVLSARVLSETFF